VYEQSEQDQTGTEPTDTAVNEETTPATPETNQVESEEPINTTFPDGDPVPQTIQDEPIRPRHDYYGGSDREGRFGGFGDL